MLPLRSHLISLITLAILCISPSPEASATELSEYELKAAYLYQFTKFIEWPPESFKGSEFVLCIAGKDPFGKTINELASESVNDRPIRIERLNNGSISNCSMLFISRLERKQIPKLLEEVNGKPVFTVAEVKGFIENGGMVNFIKEGNKIIFEINQQKAEKAGIRISSKLLRLASLVI